MKKTFSWVTAILTGLVLMVTSCTNASQITFQDETKGNFTEEGLSTITAKVNSTPDYSRTIFPNDWTEELKGGLLYKLTAEPTDQTLTLTQKEAASKGKTFTYKQIIDGEAVMDLDPVEWKFALEAFLPNGAIQDGNIKETALVLEAREVICDLSTGSATVNFDLKVPAKPDNSADATGKVDIQVYFYMPEAPVELSTITLDSGDESLPLVNIAAPTTTPTTPGVGESLNGKITVVDETAKYYSAHLSGDIKAGTHTFTATFKDSKPATILKHEETLYVDGGNLSQKIIYIPKDAYNSVPADPSELRAETTFVPFESTESTETGAALKVGEKVVAQSVTTTSGATTIEAVTTAIEKITAKNKYNVTFTWKDNACNEEGFKLYLSTTTAAGPATTAVLLANGNNNIFIKDNAEQKDIIPGITYVAGSLTPSSESLTISLPTGTFIKNVSLKAYNNFGDCRNNAKLIKKDVAKKDTYKDPDDYQADPIGKFTIAYNMYNLGKEIVPVKYYSGPAAKVHGFVLAYDYGDKTTELLAGSKTTKYPYVENTEFQFGGWSYKGADNTIELVRINIQKEPPAPESAPETPPTETDFTKANTNVTVFASWLARAHVTVKFPNYDKFKDLAVTSDQNLGEILEPKADDAGNIAISVTIPEVVDNGTVSAPIFKIFGNDSNSTLKYDSSATPPNTDADTMKVTLGKTSEEASGIDNGKLTWNIKDTSKTGYIDTNENTIGVYRIYIAYTFTENETNRTYTVDGNLYVKLTKINS